MSYESLDEYSEARAYDNFHDAKVEAKTALDKNDLIQAAIAIGSMATQFDLLWQHKEIVVRKFLEQKSNN